MIARALRMCAIVFPLVLAAQTTGMLNLYPANPVAEQTELNQAVNEANGSAVDVTRALEQHLLKYPNSARRAEMEATLYKNATDANDTPRIVLYGEKLLLGKPDNELEVLDRVIRALEVPGDEEAAKKAMGYVIRYEAAVKDQRERPPEGHTTVAQWADLADRAFARVSILHARAIGTLGNSGEALTNADHSWLAFPSSEAAHERARWLVKLGRDSEAIDRYAEAVMIEDPRALFSDRDRDRKQATDLYVKLHGSDQGLGDLFLKAWDRTAQAMDDRLARYRAMDRNYGLTDAFEYVLPSGANASPDAAPLDMTKLKGKTVVIDFWATWCVPCLGQHPLIAEVKQKYASDGDVVFLSLDADDDHSLVAPFLKAQKWDERVYLEGGLAGLMTVASLPTVMVLDPAGKLFSRMTGFIPNEFERMLSTRIDEARAAVTK